MKSTFSNAPQISSEKERQNRFQCHPRGALVRVNTKYAESWMFMANLTLSTVIVNVEYTAFVSSPKQLTTVTSTRACQRERREKTSSLHRALEPVTKRFYNEGLAI